MTNYLNGGSFFRNRSSALRNSRRKSLLGTRQSSFYGNNSSQTNPKENSFSSLFGPQNRSTSYQNGNLTSSRYNGNSIFGSNMNGNDTGSYYSSRSISTFYQGGSDNDYKPNFEKDSLRSNRKDVYLHTICAMEKYSKKSPEELRLEDMALHYTGSLPQYLSNPSLNRNTNTLFGRNRYDQNNRGSRGLFQSSNTGSSSLFGNRNSNSLFGNRTNNNRSNTTGIFGNNYNFSNNESNSLFGNRRSGLFTRNSINNSNQRNNSLFGNRSNSLNSIFGNRNDNRNSNSLFGNRSNNNRSNNTGIFGNNYNFSNNESNSLFGNRRSGLFTRNSINNSNQRNNSLFGNRSNSLNSIFGNRENYQNANSLFGNRYRSSILFGYHGNNSIFGNRYNRPNSIFSTDHWLYNKGGSIFSSNSLNTSEGNFKYDQSYENIVQIVEKSFEDPYGYSLSPLKDPIQSNYLMDHVSPMKKSNNLVNQKKNKNLVFIGNKQNNQENLQRNNLPPVQNEKILKSNNRSIRDNDNDNSYNNNNQDQIKNVPIQIPAKVNQYTVTVKSPPKTKIKPRSYEKVNPLYNDHHLNELKLSSHPNIPHTPSSISIKKIIINDPNLDYNFKNSLHFKTPLRPKRIRKGYSVHKNNKKKKNQFHSLDNYNFSSKQTQHNHLVKKKKNAPKKKIQKQPKSPKNVIGPNTNKMATKVNPSNKIIQNTNFNTNKKIITSPKLQKEIAHRLDSETKKPTRKPFIFTKKDYYTIPPSRKLLTMSVNQLSKIEDLVIGRKCYGEVMFPGITDINNLNLEDIVFFYQTQIIVYPDVTKKPKPGEGLNKRARILLQNCYPLKKGSKEYSKNPEKIKNLVKKLKMVTKKFDGKFINWSKGKWIFEVENFGNNDQF
ncbi:nuclear pore complex protein nup98-nup96 [Anaeramoeba flamelloides]|uniref:Nuclear pore complex protein nup98-nup96 n=1 Tax=Anaeramoeba flamelloides TaxID=1746091 RepID=A0ABQ8XKJ0_9EUKA|nr:nuclear pore complex protein nup98-nup96 [Anaeramoeba flamelloides]